jgi:hypothetical protein
MAELERSIDELIRGLTEKYGHLCEISPRRATNEKPFIKEELEENHAHARHLSHTTHAVKKLPTTIEPLTTPARSGCPN